MCGFAAQESMVIPCGMESPFSFPLAEKKLTGKAVNSLKAGAGRHALPTKSGSCLPAALYPNIKSAYPRI